jgi:hypothetical protein
MKEKLKLLLTSRKFWALIIGLVLIITKAFRPDFPLTEDQLIPIVAILASFILGTAVEDAGRSISQTNTSQSETIAVQRDALATKNATIEILRTQTYKAIGPEGTPSAPPIFRSGPD